MKKISTQELKASVGEVVDSVRLRHDRFTIERRGEPVAVMLSVREYELLDRVYREAKRELLDTVRELREQFDGVDPEELEREIAVAVREVRAERAARRQAESDTLHVAESSAPYGPMITPK